IVPGEVNQHFVNMGDIRTSTFFAAHSHGEFDEVGASTGTKPPSDVSEVQRMHELGKDLPIYIVSRAGIVLYDVSATKTQVRTPGNTPGHDSRGIIVGQLDGKNSIFNKPCAH